MSQVVIVDNIRTGLAKAHRGTFNMSRSDDLVAHCIDALLERNPQVDAAEIEDVILGCGRQVGEQSGNVARHAVVLSKLPITVPATTISRACSSGLNSIAFAANQVASGCADIVMAGGVESITGLSRGEPAKFEENPRLLEEKPDVFMAMGNTAEVVARRYQVSRESQDEYALQSQ
ncbi:MAG: beta-ketoacyl synthase N-terminal-like domain-containing protein, partial [Gammaproteobacteria bacterium]|nr:beta-ketoacyl synthase N-terminal-like domain-containing protein [Gammaproteobacteria bacterium]